jgi:hypothetical protein
MSTISLGLALVIILFVLSIYPMSFLRTATIYY